MIEEFLQNLSTWREIDDGIVLTAALVSMSCAIPGVFLLLRRQSMMGDALSHTVLLGVVGAFLISHWMEQAGWITEETYVATKHTVMFVGAVVVGILSALLTEWIRKLGQVESSASLGVVFTTLFAIGLVAIRMAADNVHVDPECVLYGNLESVAMDTYGNSDIPHAAIVSGIMLLINLGMTVLFYKEIQMSTFDPDSATALGVNATIVHYALMCVTAATLVLAFESVGSIIVIAMLIVPAATAHLLTDRLHTMIIISLVIGAVTAISGHVMAITLPSIVFSRLGFETVDDANTAGMMAVAVGMIFVVAMLFGPRHGAISKGFLRFRISFRIVMEDILGFLYRFEEMRTAETPALRLKVIGSSIGVGGLSLRFAAWSLTRQGLITGRFDIALTESGRERAQGLVRSHRLWESYMSKHFNLEADHLHEAAARVEHFIDDEMRDKLADELDSPDQDPHGRGIPGK